MKEELSGSKRTAVCGNSDARYAPRAAAFAESPGVHHHHGADARAGHRRDHFDLHFGARRPVEVAGRWRIPANCTGWGKNRVAAIGAGTARTKSFPWSLTICTNTSETTPKGLRNWRRSRRSAARCSASGARAARRRPKAIPASSSPAITSPCSASRRMPDARSPQRDDRAGAPPVAVMSYRLWQQKVRIGSVRHRQRLQSQ